MRLCSTDMEIKMRRYVRDPEVEDKIIFRYEGWMNRNICAVFASAKFWWLGELIEIGNTGMTYLVQYLLFYYIVPKETFVFLGSSFSKIAPICVHSLFKIIFFHVPYLWANIPTSMCSLLHKRHLQNFSDTTLYYMCKG